MPKNITQLAGGSGFANAAGVEVRFNEVGALIWQNDRVFSLSISLIKHYLLHCSY